MEWMGFGFAPDKIRPSCEIFRALAGKEVKVESECGGLPQTAYAAFSLFLLIATRGVVLLQPRPGAYAKIEPVDERACLFRLRTSDGVYLVKASENDGRDALSPWEVSILL